MEANINARIDKKVGEIRNDVGQLETQIEKSMPGLRMCKTEKARCRTEENH